MHRPLQPQDRGAVFEIYMDPTVQPFLGFEKLDQSAFQGLFDELVAGGLHYVYEEAGRVLAVYELVRCRGRCRHVAYFGSFALKAGDQKHGNGRRIFAEIVNDLRQAGIRRIEGLVEADNARALGFYEACGGKREGVLRQRFQRGTDGHPVDQFLYAVLL